MTMRWCMSNFIVFAEHPVQHRATHLLWIFSIPPGPSWALGSTGAHHDASALCCRVDLHTPAKLMMTSLLTPMALALAAAAETMQPRCGVLPHALVMQDTQRKACVHGLLFLYLLGCCPTCLRCPGNLQRM